MNFNLIPDDLVNKFQQADDEAAVIDIISMDKNMKHDVIECNPDIDELELFITVKNEAIDDLTSFLEQKTDENISKNKLASENDYNLVFRMYDDNDGYIDFGILSITFNKDENEYYQDKTGVSVKLHVHTFDKEKMTLIYLEDAEYVELYDHQDRKVKIDAYDNSILAEYTLKR